MIVAFSTSSPVASVALIDEDGAVLGSASEEARMNASGVCLRLLQGLLEGHPGGVTAYLADLGPGSFTGVKVGVTMAKTMAMARGVPAGGASAFDLISTKGLVVLPSKKGEFFWRHADRSIEVHTDLPLTAFVGYGPEVAQSSYPLASGFGSILSSIELEVPLQLVPLYLLEPSISVPNKPYRESSG